MDLKLGLYFDTRTGEEVEIIAIDSAGNVMVHYLSDHTHEVIDIKTVKNKFIPVEDITDAANILFSDDGND